MDYLTLVSLYDAHNEAVSELENACEHFNQVVIDMHSYDISLIGTEEALFEKIWIEEDGHVTTEFTNVYKHIAQPVINEIASRNTQKTACDESHAVFITKLLKSYSNFFGKGLNNEFLVDLAGVEPASESPSTRASPITVIILTFPPSVT